MNNYLLIASILLFAVAIGHSVLGEMLLLNHLKKCNRTLPYFKKRSLCKKYDEVCMARYFGYWFSPCGNIVLFVPLRIFKSGRNFNGENHRGFYVCLFFAFADNCKRQASFVGSFSFNWSSMFAGNLVKGKIFSSLQSL